MNKISARKEAIIDRMMCLAYPIRVICEVVEVSRNTVQVRRGPMVYGRGFWFVRCPCGKWVIDPDTDHFHDQEPCKRRARRNRLLLRLVRNKRAPTVKERIKLTANCGQYIPVGRPPESSKQALRDMLAEAVCNTVAIKPVEPREMRP
jgi:hypothetical protein